MLGVQDSIEKYQKLSDTILAEEVAGLVRICRLLHLPQKTVAVVLHVFFMTKHTIDIEPDDAVLHSACISIACKVCETHRPCDRILDCAALLYAVEMTPELRPMYANCIAHTELSVCYALDFDFGLPDFYGLLKRVCRENSLPTDYSRRCWVMLNDILATPVSVFFSVEEITLGAICAEWVSAAAHKEAGGPTAGSALPVGNSEVVQAFLASLKMPELQFSDEAIAFVALEICALYSKSLVR
ncbi:hypothetical protein PAPHI01_0532 [Pancytospora philotis]|nr:hypothetical protein PAPHI01_0532 [Pancytospora philotis]